MRKEYRDVSLYISEHGSGIDIHTQALSAPNVLGSQTHGSFVQNPWSASNANIDHSFSTVDLLLFGLTLELPECPLANAAVQVQHVATNDGLAANHML